VRGLDHVPIRQGHVPGMWQTLSKRSEGRERNRMICAEHVEGPALNGVQGPALNGVQGQVLRGVEG
jgi:hypothetical protein